jgi:hypothetical protein
MVHAKPVSSKLTERKKENRLLIHGRPLECKCGCNQLFQSTHDLNNHQQAYKKKKRTKHPDNPMVEKKHKCPLCQYQSDVKSTMQEHIQYIHKKGEQEQYQCDFCDFRTHRKGYLTIHLKDQHNVRYKCPDCDYTTKVLKELEQHQVKTHYEGETLQCEQCDKVFTNKQTLRSHNRSHSKLKCDQCKFETTRPVNMHRHKLLQHADEIELQNGKRKAEEEIDVVVKKVKPDKNPTVEKQTNSKLSKPIRKENKNKIAAEADKRTVDKRIGDGDEPESKRTKREEPEKTEVQNRRKK